jgi:tetratricopeptide (TPR) repeat protein
MSFFTALFKGKKESDLKGSTTETAAASKNEVKKEPSSAYESYACLHGGYVYFFVAKTMQSVNDKNAIKIFEEGLDCLEKIKPAEAILAFKKVCERLPGCAEVRNNLAVALFFQHRSEKDKLEIILGEFNVALKLKPDSAEVHSNIGNVYEFSKELNGQPDNHARAINEYKRSIELMPNCPEIHNNLGKILGDTIEGRMEAIEEFLKAIRLKPNLAEAYINMGDSLKYLPKENANFLDYVKFQLSEILPFSDSDEVWALAYVKAISINCNLGWAYWKLGDLYLQKYGLNKYSAYKGFIEGLRNIYYKS